MAGAEVGVVADPETEQLAAEVTRLRGELATSRAVSAQALARATRLAQLVSALGQVTDAETILERAACQVAEQFSADIAVVLTRDRQAPAGVRLAAQWGLAARQRPASIPAPPADVSQLNPLFPVLAGPVAEVGAPIWLDRSRPRHVAWGLLSVRSEDLGYLMLARRAEDPFLPDEVQELGAVVGRIALALDNARLHQHTQDQLRRLQRLHEVTTALAGIVDVDLAVRAIADTVTEEVPLTGVAVYLADSRGLELAIHRGFPTTPPLRLRDRAEERPEHTTMVQLVSGASRLGALALLGAPEPDTEAYTFMEHLADISSLVLEKALLFDRIRAQAETDALTGLPNRSLFLSRLDSALSRCRQVGSDLGVIFIDLDGFKAVNDTHGHDAGDRLLAEVARRLTASVRPSDTPARIGGDEFVVLCENIPGPEAQEQLAHRISEALALPHRLEVPGGRVTVLGGSSVGFATTREAGYDATALMRTADAAMYEVKQRHRSA